MERVQNVLKDVLKETVPSKDEKENVERLREKILSKAYSITKNRYDIEPMFCGSIAKGTWLSGQKDLDLFLLFQERVPEDKLEEVGLDVSKQIVEELGGRWEIAYAEHPYLQAEIEGHKVDIVPAYDIDDTSEMKSSVDRTPHHVRYIQRELDKNLLNQVRLLKKFCKGGGVYGSDLKTQGFSGYLCELLILEYGTFDNLLQEAKDWSPGIVIDMENHYSRESYVRREKFPEDALIVLDPVDKDRNVASVLSLEQFLRFTRHVKNFLEDPKMNAFFQLPVMPPETEEIREHMEDRGTTFALIRFQEPDVLDDVLWPQIRKFTSRLQGELEDNEFKVLRTGAWSEDTTIVVLELLVEELPAIKKKMGPSAFDEKNSEGFLEHYKGYNVFVEDGKWVAEYDREYQEAIDLIRDFLQGDKGTLKDRGVPSYIAESIHDNVEVATGPHAIQLVRRYSGLRKYLHEYFHKNLV